MEALAIGKLAALTGVKVTTIRYYESVGLLPTPPRTGGNRRTYGQSDVDCLIFIRRGRDFGLSMDAIRALLGLEHKPDQPCQAATRIAEKHLAEVERKITELEALKIHFRRIIDRCDNNRIDSCLIMKTLRGDAE
jgi:DNA-binding transcriptional MerR regulator